MADHSEGQDSQPAGQPSAFPDTRWSVVVQAKGDQSGIRARALADLCQSYWHPLYCYVRSRGQSPHDAEDVTQAFFAQFLAKNSIRGAEKLQGRFRAYLLGAMKNFLASEWRKGMARKRGQGAQHISIDRDWAENQLGESGHGGRGAAELIYDQTWARGLLRAVSDRLERFYRRNGQSRTYEPIKDCLEGGGPYRRVAEVAEELQISPEGVRAAVFKLRRRFRDYLIEAVADTCDDPAEVREEIAYLCRIVSS